MLRVLKNVQSKERQTAVGSMRQMHELVPPVSFHILYYNACK